MTGLRSFRFRSDFGCGMRNYERVVSESNSSRIGRSSAADRPFLERSFAITFDDGYQAVHERAFSRLASSHNEVASLNKPPKKISHLPFNAGGLVWPGCWSIGSSVEHRDE
jgi:hypothetical protein